MGNVIDSLLSGFGHAINKLLGSPLDFLSGKSCNSVCGTTWDLLCYIENFCIAHLLKMAMVSILFYLVLAFFYLLYKLGICHCICWTFCNTIWACFALWFSAVECCCNFLCYKLPRIKRRNRRHKRDIEECNSSSNDEEDGSFSHHRVPKRMQDSRRSMSRRWRDYKGDHLRRSLRARSHRVKVGIRKDSITSTKYGRQGSRRKLHDVRVIQSSKFARKGAECKGFAHRTRIRRQSSMKS
ncbi:hypothetical protein NMG60_11017707 [Bertholletia excelsa]